MIVLDRDSGQVVEYRIVGTGELDPAQHIGRIAGEERAELVIVGSKPNGRQPRPPLRSRLASELPRTTPVPVVVVPPQLPARAPAKANAEPSAA